VASNKGYEALNAYCEEIQKIVSCITNEVWYGSSSERDRLNFSVGDGFFRVAREDNTYLYIDINQEIEDPKTTGTVTTKYYLYSIADADGKDLVGFHFHPDLTEDPILYPHIHAYANQDPRYLSLNLHRKHIPSGRVALEDVIRWLISELKVKPLRKNWDDVLTKAKARFLEIRSWS
jgi:hypothetical protein